jgi:hypothetical protein
MYKKSLMNNLLSRFQLKVNYKKIYIFLLITTVPTYGHQEHIIWIHSINAREVLYKSNIKS